MTSWFGSTVRTGRMLLRGLAVLVFMVPIAACDQAAEAPADAASAPPPAVTVITLKPTEITPGIEFNGRVVAVDKVELRARVTGFLEQRLFTEGQDVEKGDLLFVIEQPPFQVQVAQAEAELARTQASLAEANATQQRVQQAATTGAVSEQDVDEATAAAQRAQAQVQVAEAHLELAQLELGYTEIHAPIGGRIGLASFTVGNLVDPDSGVLATIVSQDPIHLTFPISQRQLLDYRREGDEAAPDAPASDEVAATDEAGSSVVRITLPDDTLYEHPGKLDFIDVQVDPGTDTVTVRAELPNPDRTLVDGQFVNVRLERGEPEVLLAIPQAALQVDQAGPFVLVVGEGDEVEARRVALGEAEGTQAVVQEGLKEGERVIVEGIQKVRPGLVVAATEFAAPAAPASEAAPAAPESEAAPAAPESGSPAPTADQRSGG